MKKAGAPSVPVSGEGLCTQVDRTLALTPGIYPSIHLSLRVPTVGLHYHIKDELGAVPRPRRERRASTSTAS